MQLATFDIETDPFKHGRIPKPFAVGFYTKNLYQEWWGENCLDDFIGFLNNTDEKYRIFAHNGGKFDFHYLYKKRVLENPIKIINGRIVLCNLGKHELRDSYAAIPIPLSAYKKDEIDYKLFETNIREKYKNDILHYLASDCEYLYQLVEKFIHRFGLQLTIGGASIKQLRKFHCFEKSNESHDTKFRKYYFGGRVSCFKKGIITRELKLYDVNSMYTYVMSKFLHPQGLEYEFYSDKNAEKIIAENSPNIYFCNFIGNSNGALPIRTKNGLEFPTGTYEFNACSHEIKFALENNLLDIYKITELYKCKNIINFNVFVENFINEKISAKLNNDKPAEIFAKLLLNSAYGKTGQNPENFCDWLLRYDGELISNDWELYIDMNDLEIHRRPVKNHSYYDVAIASSITSAARTVLLNGILNSKNTVYCDTDSIICSELLNCKLSPTELGAWDIENSGSEIAVAGKKLYAFKTDNGYKISSKGCVLTPEQIYKIARGESILYKKESPTFKLTGDVEFIKRNITRTV